MTWFYVDDGLHSHPKVIDAGTPAMGLWVRAGSWCADQLTDGFVPKSLARGYGTPAMARALVDAGLWVPDGSGYRFHQWNEPGRQPTRAEVEERRRQRSEAGRIGGKRSGETRRTGSKVEATAEAPGEASASAKTNPVPSRPPNPSLVTLVCRRLAGDARRATTTDDERAELWAMWADVAGPNVDLEAELRLWLMRNAETDLRDPGAALLGWLRKASERAAKARPLGCPACRSGWLEDDEATGRPVPCPTCRPHLQAVAS